jgi:DNA-binding MarR family transcriptional regulator
VSRPTRTHADLDAVTDAMLVSSRVLVAVASRSIAAIDETVTLPQFRALVVLDTADRTVGDLAKELRVQPSTATRLCDRLVRKHLVRRVVEPSNRREVTISLSGIGRDLVRQVTLRRRREITAIMERVPAAQRSTIVEALTAFRDAAGEEPLVHSVPW